MPTYDLIAEYPGEGFETSLEALAATAAFMLREPRPGRPVLLSAQSYEADGELYVMFDARYQDGALQFEEAVPNIHALLQTMGVPETRVFVREDGKTLVLRDTTMRELTQLLDRIYRESFMIKLLPVADSYNFVAEVESAP